MMGRRPWNRSLTFALIESTGVLVSEVHAQHGTDGRGACKEDKRCISSVAHFSEMP